MRRPAAGGRWTYAGAACAALALALACDSATLYDPAHEDGTAPTVTLEQPLAGGEVLAGQRVPIRVVVDDPRGVTQVAVRVSGVADKTIVVEWNPAQAHVVLDTAITLAAAVSGTLELTATAKNAAGATSSPLSRSVTVSNVDRAPPVVGFTVSAAPRMEMTDSFVVLVTAHDNAGGSGLATVGMTAVVASARHPDTTVMSATRTFSPPRADTTVSRFAFAAPLVDSLALPDTLTLRIYAYAVDAAGGCAGNVGADTAHSVACDSLAFRGQSYRVAAAAATPLQAMMVAGRSSPIPGAGTLADLVVDTLRRRVYTSDLGRNRVYVLSGADARLQSYVAVGSQPWGLALTRTGDSLIVANSGGTQLSMVDLNVGAPVEDLSRRYQTPNAALFEIKYENAHYTGTFYDFSDRPQFVAQDAYGRLLYSTRPTPSAEPGTVRLVLTDPSWPAPDSRLLAGTRNMVGTTDDITAIVHIDSIKLLKASPSDLVDIYDHLPGHPGVLIESGPADLQTALAFMVAHGSDVVFARYAKWDLTGIELQDTTYVAASGDRNWVAFGEGGRGSAGRSIFWNAPMADVSYEVSVADLVNNASDRVRALDLNRDGSLGTARGDMAGYFFRPDLRLQGSFADALSSAATGAVLHPDHPAYVTGTESGPATVAFFGTGQHSIRIVDTIHFLLRGEIFIRDEVVGPLRIAPPALEDNGGRTRDACTASSCVVARLYGVTGTGRVVVVNVRRSDIGDAQ